MSLGAGRLLIAALFAPLALGLAELPWTTRTGLFGTALILLPISLVLGAVSDVVLVILVRFRSRVRAAPEDIARWALRTALVVTTAGVGGYLSNVLLIAPPTKGLTLVGYALTVVACVFVGFGARALRRPTPTRIIQAIGTTSIMTILACAAAITLAILDATSYPTVYFEPHLASEGLALVAFTIAATGFQFRWHPPLRIVGAVLFIGWVGAAALSWPEGPRFTSLARHPGLERRVSLLAKSVFGSPRVTAPICAPASAEPVLPSAPVDTSARPKTIVLITADTFRCGFGRKDMGSFRDACPALTDRLASSRFTVAAHAVAPYTSGSVASAQLSGPHPLGDRLRALGYRTSVIVNHPRILEPPGLRASFDDIDESLAKRGVTGAAVTSDETTAHALAALDAAEQRSKSVFLWVHYFDPHAPYVEVPQSPWRLSRLGAYLTEVRRTDKAAATLVDAIRARGPSVVVFSADHGEEFGEHGGYTHGAALYEESVRIPIVVWASDDATAHALPSAVPGGSDEIGPYILSVATGGSFSSAGFTKMHSDAAGDAQRGVVRSDGWKLIEHTTLDYSEVFDLTSDPEERHDVSEHEADRLRDLQCQLGVEQTDDVSPLDE